MDAEINVPFAKNSELSKGLFLKSGLGQNVALHALSASRKYAFFIFIFSGLSTSFLFFLPSVFCKHEVTHFIFCVCMI